MDHAPEHDTSLSLESASRQTSQTMKVFSHAVIHELYAETRIAIEINGVPVRMIDCMDSALAELAAGWAFLQQFCVTPDQFDRCTISEHRASVMIRSGIDIGQRVAVINGDLPERIHAPAPLPRQEEWSIPEDILLDVLRESWQMFRADGMSDGLVHAALASDQAVEVVAFDNTSENAVAKVLGWCLLTNRPSAFEILVINGPVTRRIVDAAARLGVIVIATPFVPTADAYMTARVSGMSIVGYMRNATVGLFGGPGLVEFDTSDSKHS